MDAAATTEQRFKTDMETIRELIEGLPAGAERDAEQAEYAAKMRLAAPHFPDDPQFAAYLEPRGFEPGGLDAASSAASAEAGAVERNMGERNTGLDVIGATEVGADQGETADALRGVLAAAEDKIRTAATDVGIDGEAALLRYEAGPVSEEVHQIWREREIGEILEHQGTDRDQASPGQREQAEERWAAFHEDVTSIATSAFAEAAEIAERAGVALGRPLAEAEPVLGAGDLDPAAHPRRPGPALDGRDLNAGDLDDGGDLS